VDASLLFYILFYLERGEGIMQGSIDIAIQINSIKVFLETPVYSDRFFFKCPCVAFPLLYFCGKAL
jgi:hypothetical protein